VYFARERNWAICGLGGVTLLSGAPPRITSTEESKTLKEGSVNRVPYLGGAGWLMVVPMSARQPHAALDLVTHLASSAQSMQIALEPRWGGGITRTEQALRERWDAFDLNGRRALQLKDAVNKTVLSHGLKNPVLCLRVPREELHRVALDAALREVLLKNAPPAKALADVSEKWKSLTPGEEAARVEYRISVGLSGK
jgi:hypothetical protein